MLVLIHKTTSPKVPVSFHPLPPQIFQFPDVDKHAWSDSIFSPISCQIHLSVKVYIALWRLAIFSVLVLFVYTIYIYIYICIFFSSSKWVQWWFINAARRTFNNKCADSVKVFGDTFFLLGENVSLEEIRISAILMTKHVRRLKKLMKLHIIPALSKKHIIHQLL